MNHFFSALLSQELKQDISSFRYEVMGMVKTGKPALQGAKASGSSVESSRASPNSSLKVSPSPQSSQAKSKLNRFKLITSILKQGGSTASPRPPESGLLNELGVSDESSSKSPRVNSPKDTADFGSFQKRHWSGNEAALGAGELSRDMYSLSEEAGESDAEQRDKEHRASGTDEEELPRTEEKEEAAANENNDESKSNGNSDEGGQKETEEKDEESSSCGDSAAGGCLSVSSREDA